VDFGTGDGLFAYRLARASPDLFVVGVDASVDRLREISRRAASKPARGGLPNVCFGRLTLEQAPGELAGLTDRLTILLPWGTLLAGVARPVPSALANLAGLCRNGGEFHCVLGYGEDRDDPATAALRLPDLQDPSTSARLVEAYRDAGFEVGARLIGAAELAAFPTTWAKKLAYSGKPRRFVEIRGRVIAE
jgi:16S rRNA (adenine(1408)-N(1))-methyltransferase